MKRFFPSSRSLALVVGVPTYLKLAVGTMRANSNANYQVREVKRVEAIRAPAQTTAIVLLVALFVVLVLDNHCSEVSVTQCT